MRKKKGFTLVELLVVIVAIALLMGIVVIIRARGRNRENIILCGTYLSGIGRAMLVYSNDYDNEYPRAGGVNSRWSYTIQNWMADNRYTAYGLQADGSGGMATITSSLYLLVKYAEVTPKSFVCRGDSGTREFRPADYGADYRELQDFWDFGPEANFHCSYAYHMPYGLYALTSSSEPGMAVAADRNPWITSPGAEGKDAALLSSYVPTGGKKIVNQGNAITHQEDGQNVLFMDRHVGFMKEPFCAINDDNIYTFGNGGDIRIGGYPMPNASEPGDRLDSYLVNDAEGGVPPRKGRACFLADTPVWVDGSMVKISKVDVSTCLATRLEKLEVHEGSFVCRDITLENGNRISVVDAHCFMLDSGRWIAAQDLRSGLRLKTLNGTVGIKSVAIRAVPFVGKVYNLKIKGAEKYFVGKDRLIVRDY